MLLIESTENSDNVLKEAEEHRNFLLDNYPHHYIDFCIQFSKTLYIRNWDMACEWQKLAYDSIHKRNTSESKQALKVEFSFYFTQYLRTGNAYFLKKWTIGCLLQNTKYIVHTDISFFYIVDYYIY